MRYICTAFIAAIVGLDTTIAKSSVCLGIMAASAVAFASLVVVFGRLLHGASRGSNREQL